jgi:hypothetical protein
MSAAPRFEPGPSAPQALTLTARPANSVVKEGKKSGRVSHQQTSQRQKNNCQA